MKQQINFGYTPDPDDAYHYCGLESGKINFDSHYDLSFDHQHIQTLNQRVLEGDIDVSAISTALYPEVADRYIVLPCGTSVGRGYGPVLGALSKNLSDDLAGKRIGIPGRNTTGFFLLKYFFENFKPVEMEYNEVMDAVLMREVDAGVFIHEELLNYQFRGVEKVCCLGERWEEETGLPLPVGLTVARRSLGAELIQELTRALQKSMVYAMENSEIAMSFAADFSCEVKEGVREEFVHKFANSDTLYMPTDVRAGLREIFKRGYQKGIFKNLFIPEIVDEVFVQSHR